GGQRDHRRRWLGPGDRDAAIPARHRPGVEGLGVRRRAWPHRRAQVGRLVHGQEDRDRLADHPQVAARADQRGVRSHARWCVDPDGGRVLMAEITVRSEQRCHGGTIGFYSHASTSTGTEMRFAVYVPPHAEGARYPVLYYLAGLTCTEETFMI